MENELLERLRILNIGGAKELADYVNYRIEAHTRVLEDSTDLNTMLRTQGALKELRAIIRSLEYIRKPREE